MIKVETCGKRIKDALKNRRIKNVDLANYLGVDKSLITKYINNVFSPKQEKIVLMSEYLQVNPMWLMGYDVTMERKDAEKKTKNDDNDLLLADFEKLTEEQKELVKAMIKQLISLKKE